MLARLHRWSVNVCFADCWEVYVEFIAKDLLIQAKVQAYGVECDNFRQCHWLYVLEERRVLFLVHCKWLI